MSTDEPVRDDVLRKELHEISDWLERVFKGHINFQECEYMALRAHKFLADLDDELVENVGRFRDGSAHQIARVISDDPLHQFSGKGSGHPDFMRLADRILIELRKQQHSLPL